MRLALLKKDRAQSHPVKRLHQSRGFSVMEFLLVLVVSFFLAYLILPKSFALIEFSRSMEAMNNISQIKRAVDRCFMMSPRRSYKDCEEIVALGLPDPSDDEKSHFSYSVVGNGDQGYSIKAARKTLDSGNTNDYIIFTQTDNGITRMGVGAFANVH